MILIVVLLPDPFGPSSPKTSCGRISKVMLSTARARSRIQKSLKILVSPWQATTGVVPAAGCVIIVLMSGRLAVLEFRYTRARPEHLVHLLVTALLVSPLDAIRLGRGFRRLDEVGIAVEPDLR